MLLFRRCLSSVVDEFYSIGSRGSDDEKKVVLPLRRSAASELAMLAALVPLACSDVSSPFSTEIFATDASIHKGAIVSRVVQEEAAKVLWLDGDKRGGYTRLENPFWVFA